MNPGPLACEASMLPLHHRATGIKELYIIAWVIPCYVFSWSGGEVSFAFVTGFVAKTQAPPLLLGLRASMGDCHILCGRSGVTWSASDAHRQRCERFPFATGVTGRSYRRLLSPSSSGCRCHGCADSRPQNGLFRVP